MNLQNLVDFAQYKGIDIFGGISVPSPLSADTVKSAIMIRSGLMTPLYQEPEVFKALVDHWFIAKSWTIDHLINIIQAEYSPIENYDRQENSTHTIGGGNKRSYNGSIKDTLSGTDTLTKSGSETEAHTGTDTDAHSGTDTTTNYISAENESNFQNDSKSDLLHGESIGTTYGHTITDSFTNRQDSTQYGKTNTRTYTNHYIQDIENKSDVLDSHIHGNIGIVSNQQMIEQELELLRHFDIYGYIAELFEDDNMLLIY